MPERTDRMETRRIVLVPLAPAPAITMSVWATGQCRERPAVIMSGVNNRPMFFLRLLRRLKRSLTADRYKLP
jgi:hypothetical protein